MASDAGVKNIEQLALFGKNIKNLGQNMYQTMQAERQVQGAVRPQRARHQEDVGDVYGIFELHRQDYLEVDGISEHQIT